MICIQEHIGNIDLLKLNKTAFLCSQKCPAEVVLKSYDWAKRQREEGNCIVCGNHSQIEKDVFEILLKGKQPLILVLARGLKHQLEPEIQKAIMANRLLIISPFNLRTKRLTRETASIRNQVILQISNQIVVGYKTPNGQLDNLINSQSVVLL